jgi:hypothetical protein
MRFHFMISFLRLQIYNSDVDFVASFCRFSFSHLVLLTQFLFLMAFHFFFVFTAIFSHSNLTSFQDILEHFIGMVKLTVSGRILYSRTPTEKAAARTTSTFGLTKISRRSRSPGPGAPLGRVEVSLMTLTRNLSG